MKKHSISALPLASSTHLLTHNLTPDIHTPTIHAFKSIVLTTNSSIQRRARVCPLPASLTSHLQLVIASLTRMPLFVCQPNAHRIPVQYRFTRRR
jgi:hypothetical protein